MDKVTQFEIQAVEMRLAKKFLKSFFGWIFQDWNGAGYSHISTVRIVKNWKSKEEGGDKWQTN